MPWRFRIAQTLEGGDRDPHGGELTVDAAVAPGWILLRESEDKRGG